MLIQTSEMILFGKLIQADSQECRIKRGRRGVKEEWRQDYRSNKLMEELEMKSVNGSTER
jgi:predicted GNAT family N-acyltransferase